MNLDFIWLIEHISRELDVAAAVKVLLEKKFRKTVKILPLSSTSEFSKYNPHTVLLPFCYKASDSSVLNSLKSWPQANFINLAWEQIFYKANLEYKAPHDEIAKKYVIHHSWSKSRKKFLISKNVPEKNIFVNGHPAYALYQNPYRKVFPVKNEIAKKLNLSVKKKWLFFPENYSWYFYSDKNINEIIKSGQSEEVIYIMRHYCKKAFLNVLKWLNQIVIKYGENYEIILRPRPAFSLEYFTKRLKELYPDFSSSIHIIKDYSVREFILASDLIVSSFSTSLIEAAVAGKPIAMLEPFPIPKELSASWYHLVPKIKSVQEFTDLIESETAPDSSLKLRQFAESEFFINKDPIIGLVKFLKNFDNNHFFSNKDKLIKTKQISKISKIGLKHQILNRLGQFKRRITDTTKYFQNDDQLKYKQEIKNRVNIFAKYL